MKNVDHTQSETVLSMFVCDTRLLTFNDMSVAALVLMMSTSK